MKDTACRRIEILLYLCERRFETRGNLMFEFGISKNTLDRDILILSEKFPIGTKRGSEGGVYVEDWFQLGARYLTEQQVELLERLLPNLEGKDKETMSSILKEFKANKHN